jgi:hypothetical protein
MSTEDKKYWRKVYLAAIKAGKAQWEAESAADFAIERTS